MENTSYIALSTQVALRHRINYIANNLANMNTSAYKSQKPLMHSWENPHSYHSGHKTQFVHVMHEYADHKVGAFQKNGQHLNFMIQKPNAYFVVQTPDGNQYTRSGDFHLDSTGQLINNNGYPVLSQEGFPLFFSSADGKVRVSADGVVTTQGGGFVGSLSVVSFENPHGLKREGNGLLSTNQPPQNVPEPEIVQGGLEKSNVEPILEMTSMIEAMRHYQSAHQVMNDEDKRVRSMLNTLSQKN